jgi:hypothetical protein
MTKKFIIGVFLLTLISTSFAGYSGGGRSGFSSSRSPSFSRSYSAPRTTYTRSTYSSPRTIVNNHHYSGGYGGGGFFSGFLGGYLGGTMANTHNPVIVAQGASGGVMGGSSYVEPAYIGSSYSLLGIFLEILLCAFAFIGFCWVMSKICDE